MNHFKKPRSVTFFAVSIIFFLLTACADNQRLVPLPDPTAFPPAALAATPASLPECLLNLSHKETAKVVFVTDGDTIVVDINGRQSRLRYIGIDTPEIHPTLEFLGQESSERNQELVAGKTLTLYRDQSETDRYGRLLRYVVAEGVFVNRVLVREGLADAKDYRPDTACSRELKEAKGQARRENLGIWQQP